MKMAWTTPWGTVKTSEAFHKLPFGEQRGVIEHEYGHLAHWDSVKRLLLVLSGWAYFYPQAYFAICEAQEFAADDYAEKKGFSAGLVAYLRRCKEEKIDGYPLPSERIKRLTHGR